MARNPVFEALSHFLHPHTHSSEELRFLERVHEIITEHLGESKFTTAEVAAILGMSRMHLNRKLRALTGHSTHEYLLRVRLDRARAMLSQPLPVGFIAQSFGFRSRSHFAKAFRKRFGVTPSAFRTKTSLARQPTHPGQL